MDISVDLKKHKMFVANLLIFFKEVAAWRTFASFRCEQNTEKSLISESLKERGT
jgi:hypothetical protein